MATHSSILAWRIPMDRGAWRAADHGLTQSRTRLSDGAHTSSRVHSEAGSTGGAHCLSSRLTPVLLCPLQMLVAVEHQGCSDAVTLDDTVMHQSEPSGAEEKAVLCPSRKDSHLSSPVLCFVTGDMNISACVPIFQCFFMKIILVAPLSPEIRFHSPGYYLSFPVFLVLADNNLHSLPSCQAIRKTHHLRKVALSSHLPTHPALQPSCRHDYCG